MTCPVYLQFNPLQSAPTDSGGTNKLSLTLMFAWNKCNVDSAFFFGRFPNRDPRYTGMRTQIVTPGSYWFELAFAFLLMKQPSPVNQTFQAVTCETEWSAAHAKRQTQRHCRAVQRAETWL